MSRKDAETAAAHDDPAELHVHVVPAPVLLAVWGALVVLTVATVAATWIDLGPGNLLLALGIAVFKAGAVALWFMHLRYDRPFLGVVFVAAILFVALFIGLALVDTQSYRPEIIPGYAPGISP